MGAWGDNGAIQTLLPPISLWTVFCTPPSPFSHIYIIWLKVVHPAPPPRPPPSQLLSDGWRGRGINLGFMGTPLPLSTAVCDPCLPPWLSFLDCSLYVHVCVHACGVPLSKRFMNRANDAYWGLLLNEERFISTQLGATRLKNMFDINRQNKHKRYY